MKRLLLPTVLIVFTALLSFGCSSSQSSVVPSGKSCSENVAYLQSGVDKYFQALAKYPTDVKQLAKTTDGKRPFVEGIPKCPSGNQYAIINGKVTEVQ